MDAPPTFPVGPTIEHYGSTFAIARVSEIPWPTSAGGNTQPPCLMQEFTHQYNRQWTRDAPEQLVADTLAGNPAQVAQCWHHRFDKATLTVIAELTCYVVEQDLVPYADVFRALIAKDDGDRALAEEAEFYFSVPISWSFQPGDAVGNGRHRLCALKWAGVERIAVQVSGLQT